MLVTLTLTSSNLLDFGVEFTASTCRAFREKTYACSPEFIQWADRYPYSNSTAHKLFVKDAKAGRISAVQLRAFLYNTAGFNPLCKHDHHTPDVLAVRILPCTHSVAKYAGMDHYTDTGYGYTAEEYGNPLQKEYFLHNSVISELPGHPKIIKFQ